MVRVAIVSPSYSPADAVTNDALGMSDVLTRRGHEVRLFADSHSLRQTRVGELAQVSSFLKNKKDMFLLHLSRNWHTDLELLERLKCRRVIKYHNVTPAQFFAGFSNYDEAQCELGRRKLIDLARAGCDLYL